MYIRVWQSGTYSIYDMPETQYESGWNKVTVTFNEETITNIESQSIQANMVPAFTGNFVIDIENSGMIYEHVGEFINIESYYAGQ